MDITKQTPKFSSAQAVPTQPTPAQTSEQIQPTVIAHPQSEPQFSVAQPQQNPDLPQQPSTNIQLENAPQSEPTPSQQPQESADFLPAPPAVQTPINTQHLEPQPQQPVQPQSPDTPQAAVQPTVKKEKTSFLSKAVPLKYVLIGSSIAIILLVVSVVLQQMTISSLKTDRQVLSEQVLLTNPITAGEIENE